jgi:glycosyltransferase involved in cell wall biosynthesis
MACGVGFVGPDSGVFRELAELTGAGVLYEPNNPQRLADTLRPILLDAEKAGELGGRGRESAMRHFDIERNAEKMILLFERIVK